MHEELINELYDAIWHTMQTTEAWIQRKEWELALVTLHEVQRLTGKLHSLIENKPC